MKALRVCLCLLVAFAVLAFGSNDPWSESLLEIGASLLFLWWAVVWYRSKPAIDWSVLNWPLLGFIAIGCLQLLFHGTVYAFLTRLELLKLAAYFFFFFVLTQVFRTRDDFSKLAWFLVLFCFAVSVLAIAQYFTASGAIYWLPQYKLNTTPFGPYPNRSDFAGFIELTLPVGLSLMTFRGVSRDRLPLMAPLTIVPFAAIVLSSSRGGIISFGFEAALLGLLAWKSGALRFRRSHLIAAGALATAAMGTTLWLGIGRTQERFSQLGLRDLSVSHRISMARGAARIFRDHPIKGSGLGTIVAVYPGYETAYDGRVVEHVHNDYLEALAETGLAGGLCGLAFLWLFFCAASKNLRADPGRLPRALHVSGIVGVCGILLHSFVEFNLHIPANVLLFLLQVHFATFASMAPAASTSHRPYGPQEYPHSVHRDFRMGCRQGSP
jgi:O-antigen ligase